MNWFYRFAYVLAWPFIRFFCPFRLVGLEKLPEGGAVLCANHSNAMDPILIALSLPRDVNMVIMAKDQLFRIPLLGPILRALGAFPVKRGLSDMAAIKTAMKSLMEGRRLLVFPEGTRVERQGDADAKGGAAMLAVRTGVPMVPVYCGGRHKLFHRTTIVIGDPYIPQIAGRRPTPEENHQAAEEIMRRVYAMSGVSAWK